MKSLSKRQIHRKRRQGSHLDSHAHRNRARFFLARFLTSKGFLLLVLSVSFVLLSRLCLKDDKGAEMNTRSTWEISTSQVHITPKELVWLSGFSSRNRTAESTQPLDPEFPLYARAIAIRNRTGRSVSLPLVLVSLDVIGFDRRFSRTVHQEVEKEFGISRDRIRICATHTHSGPVVSRNLILLVPDDEKEHQKISRYTESLISDILKAIRECLERSFNAVALYYAEAFVPLATNRRQVEERAFNGFRGSTEDSVPVLWFNKGKKTIAGVFGVAAHATVLTSGYRYSGDYPGFAAKQMERKMGGIWLFLAGCGGDQNIYPRGTVRLMKRHGSRLVDGILETIKEGGRRLAPDAASIDMLADVRFARRYTGRELSIRARSQNLIERRAADQLHAAGIGEDGKTAMLYPFPLGVWRLGDMNMVFMGGEPTVGYIRLLKKVGASWVVGYCQDVMGYVGTAQVITDGGREGGERAAWYYGLPSAWAMDTERRIVDNVYSMLTNLSLS